MSQETTDIPRDLPDIIFPEALLREFHRSAKISWRRLGEKTTSPEKSMPATCNFAP